MFSEFDYIKLEQNLTFFKEIREALKYELMEKVHQEQSTNIAYQMTILTFNFLKSCFTVLSGITASECYWDIIYAVLGVTLPPPHATLSHRSGEAHHSHRVCAFFNTHCLG